MSYNPNEEVLKQIKESKKAGEYALVNFKPSSNGLFSDDLGFGNSSSGYINQKNIDADSFLKNLHIKNSKKIVFNPINQSINFKPSIAPIPSKPVNIPTKERRSCNNVVSKQDISSRFNNPNLRDPQAHIDYRIGVDSRHIKR
jgi:hypothetical protein